MPKVSQAVAKETRRKIISCSFEIVLNQGEDALSFLTIAKAANISRSGILTHFKRKEFLIDEIRPMLSALILEPLDLSSPDKFLKSWIKIIDEDASYRQLLTNCKDIMKSVGGAKNLIDLIQGDKEEVKHALCYAIGYATIFYPEE
ncbi:TetR/AcrR family transcriptional regulator [Moritella sp. 24]|uniref:TetR/AcrR family transcriptional regulator n=1 Tax=Moritella sp. 24 TaxID=2746230 RepID=UPI001BAADCBC|nr:TetR/AcrR family transcriptional regulator [Moritella sp. 24]QUM76529.1 TetR/AcrR family transcriptional regulator [Moritella sp. 24]